jgi:hypothetical protein
VSSAFLADLLNEYGRPLDRYSGSGTLANDNGSAAVEWAAAQYDDGQVLLACQGDASVVDVMFTGPTRFNGINAEGIKFDCRGNMLDLPFLRPVPTERAGGWAVYKLGLLHADFPASGPPGLVRYLLTNFDFDRRGPQRTDLRLSGVEGVVRLVRDHRDPHVAERLRVLRSPRPTAWLEIVPQGGQAVTTRPIANHVCYLLSVARGTKVAWIQEELLNTDGVRTHLNHSPQITKPFTPLAPIEPSRIGGIPEFLEMTYHVYVERREVYRLDHGTIDSVLDAKVQTDFLETRGAKLAVALEVFEAKRVAALITGDRASHCAREIRWLCARDCRRHARHLAAEWGRRGNGSHHRQPAAPIVTQSAVLLLLTAGDRQAHRA